MAQLTKNAIIKSFIKLFSERPIEKISIKDIVDDCGITRNAFYYYFQDIYAVLDELLMIETKKVIESDSREEKWEDRFLNALGFIVNNKKMMLHIYNSERRNELFKYFDKAEEIVINQYIEDLARGIPAKEEDKRLINSYFRWALRGAFSDWMKNGQKESLEDNLHRLGVLFEGVIFRSLERSAMDGSP